MYTVSTLDVCFGLQALKADSVVGLNIIISSLFSWALPKEKPSSKGQQNPQSLTPMPGLQTEEKGQENL